MLIGPIAIGFPGLGHHIAHVDLHGLGPDHCIPDAGHDQTGQHAGIQAAGPQDDGIGLQDGIHGPLGRPGIFRFRHQLDDFMGRSGNGAFPHHGAAVVHFGLQLDIVRGVWPYMAPHFQDLAGGSDALFHVPAFHITHGGNEQVAQVVAAEGTAFEPVLHDFFHQRFRIRQRHQAVPHITGRQDPQFLPQPAG